jgi:5-methylcytosine-specific restriction endonuclease McrA
LGWVILGIVVALLAFSLYRFPAFRGLFLRTAKKAGESIAYQTKVSEREPLPPDLREHILQRAHYRCENPACKEHVKPEIHHIDGNNSNNSPRNLIALCPNCHVRAGDGVYSYSQLRNWVRSSWETYKRNRRRFQA